MNSMYQSLILRYGQLAEATNRQTGDEATPRVTALATIVNTGAKPGPAPHISPDSYAEVIGEQRPITS